jgi:type III restriction enzyme
VEKHLFAAVKVVDESGPVRPLGTEGSDALWNHLKAQGYIDPKGKVTDALRTALNANNVVLPEERVPQTTQIVALLKKVAGGLQIKNVADRTQVRLNKERFLSDDFKALWDQIKYRTTFMVDFDVDQLITDCAEAIKKNVNVPKARYVYTVAAADITRAGVDMEKKRSQTQVFEQENLTPPDILSVLQNDTNLTRKSLVAILRKAGNLFAFKRNPTKYIEQVTKIIKAKMQTFIVDGIKYHRLGDNEFYGQELFKDEELFGYLERDMVEGNMVEAKDRSIYEHVVCDSKVERGFAEGLNASEEVKVFAKLPSWFKIDTPLGSYNPDWVVLVKKADGQEERLFFVVETKGEVMFDEALRPTEVAKIKCGEAHFKALGTNVVFEKASSYDAFMGTIG